MSDDKNKYIPTEEDRLHQYFSQLASVLPNPPKDWAKAARLCKWDRMLKERKNKNESISISRKIFKPSG
jgi:hypothetical protein